MVFPWFSHDFPWFSHTSNPLFISPGMLSKALELWAFRVAVLCKSIQAKVARVSGGGFFGDNPLGKNLEKQGKKSLVLHELYDFPYIGNFIIPTD